MTRWVRLAVEVEGPFFADAEPAVGSWGISGLEMPDGTEWISMHIAPLVALSWPEGTFPVESHSENYRDEVVFLGEVDGVPIHCKSTNCLNGAVRHRRPPPMVAKVICVWNGPGHPSDFYRLMPSSRHKESRSTRASDHDVLWLPAAISCRRCGATGKVTSAKELSVRWDPDSIRARGVSPPV